MEELVTCEGTVHSIIFQNAENGYTVLRLLTEEGEVITVVGCIPCVAPGEKLTADGLWVSHPSYGQQFAAETVERLMPETEEELISYLSSGIIKGVGPATAERLVERFGGETLAVIEEEPERLSTVKGITSKRAMEISAAFRELTGLRRVMEFLARYELPVELAMRLYRTYGADALPRLRADPYLLAGERYGVAFADVDEIALSMGFGGDSPCRTEAAVLCLCFGLTMGAELMNTAVERLCDKTARGYDRMVRDAKDIAAAAVFVCAAACVAVGVCIFLAHGVLAAALRFLAARLWLAMVFLVTVTAAVGFVFFFGRKQ